ncbi:ATP-grasp fold amidoligase family protein [Pseudoalteromonas gelatinilytica]|uniref:Glycosyl transferase n=1 Tax=Pseudoalteromonas gelatinilytica TaxID=1703256 RepID=A0A3A3EPF2_9GAMM|nr:ATP-grasp fold amidoligase family protein [Pseudoalteromonas profundi]RJF37999.1 glycosyl transferase [Pseudoalteromonas profundi]
MTGNLLSRVFRVVLRLVNGISPVLATKILHYKVTGKHLDLDNPVDFNSKLQWLKLFDKNEFVKMCADKYQMYKYVESKNASGILNNLVAVYDKPEEIDWDNLPEKVAIKCTHGCGYNIVTKKSSLLHKEKVIKKLSEWLKEDFGLVNLEYQYSKIKPRIIIEEYIENKKGELPIDYKIYCFDGVAKLVLVCSERDTDLRLDFFDLNWNRLNIGHPKNESKEEPIPPACFNEMIQYAELLSKDFKFVRIDFYDNDGKPILGEFTFTPAANMATYYNEFGLRKLGGYIKI